MMSSMSNVCTAWNGMIWCWYLHINYSSNMSTSRGIYTVIFQLYNYGHKESKYDFFMEMTELSEVEKDSL